MSDYTPTTWDVKNGFTGWLEEREGRDMVVYEEGFDRWLNEERAMIWDSAYNQGFDDAWHISSGTYSKRVPNPYRS